MKKLKTLLLFAIIILLTACAAKAPLEGGDAISPTQPVEPPPKKSSVRVLRLPYCVNDAVDPFAAKTKENMELTTLLYEPLIRLDAQFSPVMALADRFESTPFSCVVYLKSGLVFSDGSAVTPFDVVQSFGRAQECPRYAVRCGNIASVTAGNDGSVVFSLAAPDVNFINLLDIPIIKAGSDNRTNTDNKPLPPIGCGRYVPQVGDFKLVANPDYWGPTPQIAEIILADTPDDESLYHLISRGQISACYADLSDREQPGLSGQNFYVNQNNLVFLGINPHRAALQKAMVRRALNLGVDRLALAKTAYFGNAAPALSPFHPAFYALAYRFPLPETKSVTAARNDLIESGYTEEESPGGALLKDGQPLTLTLLLNAENPERKQAAVLAAKQLGDAGFKIILEELPFIEYNNKIKQRQYDLFIGEMLLPNNMDISLLLPPAGATEDLTRNAFAAYRAGEVSLEAVLDAFYNEYPLVPLVYRRGSFSCTDNIIPAPISTVSDIYFNIEAWDFA